MEKGEIINEKCFKIQEFWLACSMFKEVKIKEIIVAFNEAVERGVYGRL